MNIKYFRAKPYIPNSDKEWILEKYKEILDTRGLIQGKYVSQFEEEVRKKMDKKKNIFKSSQKKDLENNLKVSEFDHRSSDPAMPRKKRKKL